MVADRIRGAIRGITLAGVTVTASIGLSGSLPAGGDDLDELLRVADAALYVAKDTGRDKTCTVS